MHFSQVICTSKKRIIDGNFAWIDCLAGAARAGVVAAGVATGDENVLVGEVRARSVTAEDVVVVRVFINNGARHIDEGDVGDDDAVGGLAGGATVEVVLLDIEAVVGNATHGDVLVGDVGDQARGVGVALDAGAVARVHEPAVAEDDAVDRVVRLAADRADGQAVASLAVHVVHDNVGAAGDSYAVVLVDDVGVLDGDAVTARHAESVAVVGGGFTVRQVIGLETFAVVHVQAVDCHVAAAAGDLDTVDGPVLDVQALDKGVGHTSQLDEPVGLGSATVGALAVPVGGSVALEHVSLGSRDGQAGARDLDGKEIMVGSVSE